MKKIIRGIFIGIFSVIIIAVSAVAVMLFGPEGKTEVVRPTVTDVSGNVYLQAVGEAGEIYAAVTDSNGNIWAAEYENGKVGNTVASLNGEFNLTDIPKNYEGEKFDETVNASVFTGNVQTEPTTTEPPQTSNPNPSTPKPTPDEPTTDKKPSENKPFRMEKYQNIFKSNTYLMEFTTDDPDLGDTPIVAAAKGGNILIETSIEGIECKMLYLSDKDTTYLLFDSFKKYCKLPESLLGEDMDMKDLNMGANFASDVTSDDIEYTTVTISGQTLNCESYTTDDGKQMKYYFDGDTLVRLDCVSKDGVATSTFISRISSDVPDSTFEIPKNYGYLNLSWLGLGS